MIAVIARLLAADRGEEPGARHSPLKALAFLNRTSHSVHGVTLPILYEHTYLDSEEVLGRVARGLGPDGSQHTK